MTIRDEGHSTTDQHESESDRTLLDLDQTQSDADQTASDADQESSDADLAASRSDQRGADREQRASERDQQAADRDHSSGSNTEAVDQAYDASRGDRAQAARERHASGAARAAADVARSRDAMQRDETARLRDLTAISRDRAAEARDRASAKHAKALLARGLGDETLDEFLSAASSLRERAAADRARAAADREQAEADRAQAAVDRRQARLGLMHADVDDLTGAYMRDSGRANLQQEIDRARRSGEQFVLAFIDVDGLKEINDHDGHQAGDAVLRAVVNVLQAKLRSYDPVVRIGGDEFLCGFSNTNLDASQRRAQEIQESVADDADHATVAIGLATLTPEDTLDTLVDRADANMYEHKQHHATRRNQPRS